MHNRLTCRGWKGSPDDSARTDRRCQLACENDIAHVVVMPNVTLPKLEEFCLEYIQSRARSAALAATAVATSARQCDPTADL